MKTLQNKNKHNKMSNFDYLCKTPQFKDIAKTAQAAEALYHTDKIETAKRANKAAETAVRFIYSIDQSLNTPWKDTLTNLINEDAFYTLVGHDLFKKIELIRKTATIAENTPRKLSDDAVLLTLQNLFSLTDFIAYNYAPEYTKHTFSKAAIPKTAAVQYKEYPTETGTLKDTTEITLEELMESLKWKRCTYQYCFISEEAIKRLKATGTV